MVRGGSGVRRVVGVVVPVVAGTLVAVLGTSVHLVTVGTSPRWPVGVMVALGLLAATHVWLGSWSRHRGSLLVAGITWGLVCLAFATPRPEGDLLIPGVGRSYAWLVLGAFTPVVIAFWPGLVAPRVRRAGSA